MTTPAERKALLFFAALIVVGAGVRVARAVGAEPLAKDDRLALARQIDAVDAAREAKGGKGGGRARKGSASRGSRATSGRSRSPAGGSSSRSLDAAERSARAAAAAIASQEALEEAWATGHARPSTGGTGSSAAVVGAGRDATASTSAREDPIDVDTATPSQLEKLPRIGPSLARRIAEDRKRNGPFGSMQGLLRVRGIGPKMAEQLQGRVTFSGRRQE